MEEYSNYLSYFYRSTLCRVLSNNSIRRIQNDPSGIFYDQECGCKGAIIDKKSFKKEGNTLYFSGSFKTVLRKWNWACLNARYDGQFQSVDDAKFEIMITIEEDKVDLVIAIDTKRKETGIDYVGNSPYGLIYKDGATQDEILIATIEESFALTPKGLLLHQNHILEPEFEIYDVGKSFSVLDGINKISADSIFELPPSKNIGMTTAIAWYKERRKTM
jgi:hypothetical protein